MKILFVHQNFPGQFKHLAPALKAAGHEVLAIAVDGRGLPGIPMRRYKPQPRAGGNPHPWLVDLDTKTIRGTACAHELLALRGEGFVPDVVVGHPGWGETLFLKDVFPRTRLLSFIEFHYLVEGGDMGFDPEFPLAGFDDLARLRMKNANSLLALDAMDWGLCPTRFQHSTIPAIYRDRVSVIFDGIDTDAVKPGDATVTVRKPDGSARVLKRGDEVITFVNRNLEPLRGYHRFMRALPEIQRRRPDAFTVIVGGDDVSYGARPPGGRKWKDIYLDEVRERLDMSRITFVGKVPYDILIDLFRLTACHVYLTYPFVLSWSMIEAMSAGALVVGSRTAPVEEVIEDGVNGVLVDFFDQQALADRVCEALEHPARFSAMREAARLRAVDRYDLRRVCLPAQTALVERVARA